MDAMDRGQSMYGRPPGGAKADGSGKRSESRLDTANWIGMVVTPGGKEIACSLKDISVSGARIGVPAHVELPAKFRIKVLDRDFTAHVEIRWRRGDYVGVRIAGMTRTSEDKAKAEAAAKEAARTAAAISALDDAGPGHTVTGDRGRPGAPNGQGTMYMRRLKARGEV